MRGLHGNMMALDVHDWKNSLIVVITVQRLKGGVLGNSFTMDKIAFLITDVVTYERPVKMYTLNKGGKISSSCEGKIAGNVRAQK